jgi:hypothetical protein
VQYAIEGDQLYVFTFDAARSKPVAAIAQAVMNSVVMK